MQAIKDKISDMKAMREVKAEARAEEQAEKDIAKARMEIAHEARLAKEAEAKMELHVAKAGEKAQREIAKHSRSDHSAASEEDVYYDGVYDDDHRGVGGPAPVYTADMAGSASMPSSHSHTTTPPTHNNLI
ncbi:hypothetical protein QQ045_007300 [Rhodiola kirilowii]